MQDEKKTIKFETLRCVVCGKSNILELGYQSYLDWLGGKSVMDAFPKMDINHRELLISGIHANCWDSIFDTEC